MMKINWRHLNVMVAASENPFMDSGRASGLIKSLLSWSSINIFWRLLLFLSSSTIPSLPIPVIRKLRSPSRKTYNGNSGRSVSLMVPTLIIFHLFHSNRVIVVSLDFVCHQDFVQFLHSLRLPHAFLSSREMSVDHQYPGSKNPEPRPYCSFRLEQPSRPHSVSNVQRLYTSQ